MDEPSLYEIRVEGQLGERWSEWFGGMIVCTEGQVTVLSGVLADQAALYGVLGKLRDLNLVLVSVSRLLPANKKEE